MMLSTSATITRAPTGLATCSGRDHRTAGIPYRGGREGNPCLPGAVHARRRRPLAAAARGSGHPYRSQTPTRPNPSDRRRQVPCRPRQRGSDPEAPLSIGPRRVNCPPIAPDSEFDPGRSVCWTATQGSQPVQFARHGSNLARTRKMVVGPGQCRSAEVQECKGHFATFGSGESPCAIIPLEPTQLPDRPDG